MSIMDSFKERTKEKYGTLNAAADRLTQNCGIKIRSYELSHMRAGKRKIPECVYKLIMIDVLLTELEKAGWKNCAIDMSANQYLKLIDALSPPARIER